MESFNRGKEFRESRTNWLKSLLDLAGVYLQFAELDRVKLAEDGKTDRRVRAVSDQAGPANFAIAE